MMVLAALVVSSAAQSYEAPAPAGDAALVGRWQRGLTADLRRMAPAQREKVFGGDVVEFAGDHTVRLYPRCGPEQAAWAQRGLQYLSGTWKIAGDHTLHMAFTAMGKTMEQDTQFTVTVDELVFIGPRNPHEVMGRYAGALPQTCPAGYKPRP